MNTQLVCTAAAPLTHTPEHGAVLQDEVLYGMTIAVLEKKSGWIYIETPYRYRGYLPADCAVSANYPANLTVSAPFCDLLNEPRVDSALNLSVPRGSLLLSCGMEQDGWLAVRQIDSNRTCYVKADRVTPRAPYPETPDEAVFRKKVIRTAYAYLGAPYRWGGKTMAGIDCSGFCSMCYLLNGVVIYRDARIESGFPVHSVPIEHAKAGDLLYFPGHIALYLGEGRFLHATARSGDDGVVTASLNPSDPDFRADLAASLLAAGSIF